MRSIDDLVVSGQRVLVRADLNVPMDGLRIADAGKIRAELGWRPRVSFEEGVARMVADIDRWRDAPLWDVDSIASATRTWFKYLAPDPVEQS